MMRGKIIKGIAGFYYVYTESGLVECKAKGIFRKDNVKPLVGDDVEIQITDEAALKGNIIHILPRHNALIRPASANIDQALVIFAVAGPAPNFNLLDRFLIAMERQNLPVIICFNKAELAGGGEREQLAKDYEGSGCRVLFASGKEGWGISGIRDCLSGKTTVLAGPSGVGKSTIVNSLAPCARMETGEISRKTQRGKHTTRHAELFALSADTFIMDTPGFTALELLAMEKEELKGYYPEFGKYEENCRFGGCVHINEPDCGVKEALLSGQISQVRYDNYRLLFEEVRSRKRY